MVGGGLCWAVLGAFFFGGDGLWRFVLFDVSCRLEPVGFGWFRSGLVGSGWFLVGFGFFFG